MKPFVPAAVLLCLPLFCHAAPREAAVREIEAVVEAFRTSIIEKDKPRFVALFLHDAVTWQSVDSDAFLRHRRAKNPQARKVEVDPKYGMRSFIDGIVSDEARTEETFRNVKIDTDGDIASVQFDYAFLENGRETNYGREAWQLVDTGEGWKIVAVIWSMNRREASK
jgi:hypothetical protein